MKYKLIVLSLLITTTVQAEIAVPRSSMANAMVGVLKNICGNKEGAVEHFSLAYNVMVNSGIDEKLATDLLKEFHLQLRLELSKNPDSERCANIDYHVARIIAGDDLIEPE